MKSVWSEDFTGCFFLIGTLAGRYGGAPGICDSRWLSRLCAFDRGFPQNWLRTEKSLSMLKKLIMWSGGFDILYARDRVCVWVQQSNSRWFMTAFTAAIWWLHSALCHRNGTFYPVGVHLFGSPSIFAVRVPGHHHQEGLSWDRIQYVFAPDPIQFHTTEYTCARPCYEIAFYIRLVYGCSDVRWYNWRCFSRSDQSNKSLVLHIRNSYPGIGWRSTGLEFCDKYTAIKTSL